MAVWFENSVWLVIGGLVLSQGALFVLWSGARRQVKLVEKQIIALRKEQQALISGNLGMGRKLFKFKSNLAHLEQSQVDLKQTQSSDKSIEQAAVLLKKGVSIEEVISSCSISRGEAELMVEMLNNRAANY